MIAVLEELSVEKVESIVDNQDALRIRNIGKSKELEDILGSKMKIV